jgi:hypothetical protein
MNLDRISSPKIGYVHAHLFFFQLFNRSHANLQIRNDKFPPEMIFPQPFMAGVGAGFKPAPTRDLEWMPSI